MYKKVENVNNTNKLIIIFYIDEHLKGIQIYKNIVEDITLVIENGF